jgi:hypothetical protein
MTIVVTFSSYLNSKGSFGRAPSDGGAGVGAAEAAFFSSSDSLCLQWKQLLVSQPCQQERDGVEVFGAALAPAGRWSCCGSRTKQGLIVCCWFAGMDMSWELVLKYPTIRLIPDVTYYDHEDYRERSLFPEAEGL